MAKNDYFVLVYKILSYLYKCLKKGREPSEEYLKPLTKDFPIEYSYWSYIMEHIVTDGYVENIVIIPVENSEPIIKILDNVRITPKGIEYLQDNSSMKKVAKYLKEVAVIVKP